MGEWCTATSRLHITKNSSRDFDLTKYRLVTSSSSLKCRMNIRRPVMMDVIRSTIQDIIIWYQMSTLTGRDTCCPDNDIAMRTLIPTYLGFQPCIVCSYIQYPLIPVATTRSLSTTECGQFYLHMPTPFQPYQNRAHACINPLCRLKHTKKKENDESETRVVTKLGFGRAGEYER